MKKNNKTRYDMKAFILHKQQPEAKTMAWESSRMNTSINMKSEKNNVVAICLQKSPLLSNLNFLRRKIRYFNLLKLTVRHLIKRS